MRTPLRAWFSKYVAVQRNGQAANSRLEAMALRLRIDPGNHDYASALFNTLYSDPDKFLDVLDLSLRLHDNEAAVPSLQNTLTLGASVWAVSEHGRSLVRRVSPTETIQFANVVSVEDSASEHLQAAWTAVYGLHPDPSAAWDDCIKACEAVLKPIVIGQATMGGVVGTLRGAPSQFTLHLRDNATDPTKRVVPMTAFEQMLHFIWVNPDRHQGADHRVPTREEARAVLHIAITVVEWVRTKILTKL